jgi:hypothetical protein
MELPTVCARMEDSPDAVWRILATVSREFTLNHGDTLAKNPLPFECQYSSILE